MPFQELWKPVGDLVVQPAYHPEYGINTDVLMLSSGCLLGAMIARLGLHYAFAKLENIATLTCEQHLERMLEHFEGSLPEMPMEFASQIIVRIMPELEAVSPKLGDIALTLAAWIGAWSAQFDEAGIPPAEFIAVSMSFAKMACMVDSWNIYDEAGALVGAWNVTV